MSVEKVHNSPANRRLAGEPGIWFFVGGDLAVFTLFYVLIALGYVQQAKVFKQSRHMLDLDSGVWNTLLLLTGSWFIAEGVKRCMARNPSGASRLFLLGIACGAGFATNKVVEWTHKIADGVTPQTNDFFMYYFVFTGIHFFHVTIGIVVVTRMYFIGKESILTADNLRSIESGAIFWHLVDLLWIGLFCLFYLV